MSSGIEAHRLSNAKYYRLNADNIIKKTAEYRRKRSEDPERVAKEKLRRKENMNKIR